MLVIRFKYDGAIGKNYGIDGVYKAVKGDLFQCENVLDEKIAKIWIKEGFADEVKAEAPAVVEAEIESEEIEHVAEVDKKPKPKKRGRPAKAK